MPPGERESLPGAGRRSARPSAARRGAGRRPSPPTGRAAAATEDDGRGRTPEPAWRTPQSEQRRDTLIDTAPPRRLRAYRPVPLGPLSPLERGEQLLISDAGG